LKAHAFTSANAFLKSRRVEGSDCLILDVKMPPMGGLELQDELLRRGIRIPTIFISAHGGRAVLDRVKSGKALGFLEKPFEAHAVERLLRIALKTDP
jgi:FixJ family two-component response regulator